MALTREQKIQLLRQRQTQQQLPGGAPPTQMSRQQKIDLLMEKKKDPMGFFEKWEAYTTAPVRAAVTKLQEGEGLGEAVETYVGQLGEDPRETPEWKEILRKEGVPEIPMSEFVKYVPTGGRMLSEVMKTTDADPTLPEAAGFGLEVTADPTNIIPVGAIAKLGVKGVGAATKLTGKALAKGAQVTGLSALTKATGKAGSTASKKAFSAMFGVPEDVIDAYLKNNPRLQAMDADEAALELADRVEEIVSPMRERVTVGTEQVQRLKDRARDVRMTLKDELDVAKRAATRAQEDVLRETAPRVVRGVEELDQLVSGASAEAYRILDRAGATVDLTAVRSQIDDLAQNIQKTAVTDADQALVETLTRYRDRMEKMGESIPASRAKMILGSLDDEIRYMEGLKLRGKDKILSHIRRGVDRSLKEVPGYREQMVDVARKTRLLQKAKPLREEQRAITALQKAEKLAGARDKEVLRQLQRELGTEYLKPVAKETLPEYRKMRALEAQYEAAKRAPELKEAELGLRAAKEALAPFKAFAPDAQGYSKIQTTIRNLSRPQVRKPEYEQALAALSDRYGKNFVENIEDIRTVKAFSKEYTRGSANTLFWSVMGGFLGSTGGLGGAAGGAVLGRLLFDKYGPTVARHILDQVAGLSKMKPDAWVRSLNVPKAIKTDLTKGYRLFNTGVKGLDELRKERERGGGRVEKGPDRWAITGARKLGIQGDLRDRMMRSKKGKQLLMEASGAKPDSKTMQRVREKIRKEFKTR